MELAANAQVFVSEGNVEEHRLEILCDTTAGSEERFREFIRWQKKHWGRGLFLDMLAELDISATELTLEDTPAFSRCVVTGHWPVSLYRHEEADLRPIFEYERRIICMDGGCGLKEVGQLNALVFPDKDAGMEEIGWEYCDSFPVVTALDGQEGKHKTLYIQYFDSRVDRLEEREGMVCCRHLSSDRTLWVPSAFLYLDDDKEWHVDDYCDAQLEVKPGDRISVVIRNAAGCYGKINGVLGWYYGRCGE